MRKVPETLKSAEQIEVARGTTLLCLSPDTAPHLRYFGIIVIVSFLVDILHSCLEKV
jgi:hypothetical protein